VCIRIGFYSKDSELQRHLATGLGNNFQIIHIPSLEKFSKQSASGYHAIILDLSSGLDSLTQRISSAQSMIEAHDTVIVMADPPLQIIAEELVRQGAYGCCGRPPIFSELSSQLRNAQLLVAPAEPSAPVRIVPHKENPAVLLSSCDQLIGSSQSMNRVYGAAARVSSLNTPVLVTGESGTGKELVARAIHNLGVRSQHPFIAVSCGAIPESLIESELFGHEKGAFTGTFGQRQGYMEQAGAGTLLLDEVGDISLYSQIKLLRVLQQMEFSRLGSNHLIKLRARVIFATHRNLEEMVAAGTFRHDLYYRINVVKLKVPTLREHAEDIPEIARHFLTRYAALFEKRVESFDPKALALLQDYAWPGNVRELKNVVQSAIILADSTIVSVDDILPHMPAQDGYMPAAQLSNSSFEQRIRDYKFKLAFEAVSEHGGNKTLAARSLRISRAYLHRLLHLSDAPETDGGSEDDSLDT
jgi:DNA-binding NtrC family response regulator